MVIIYLPKCLSPGTNRRVPCEVILLKRSVYQTREGPASSVVVGYNRIHYLIRKEAGWVDPVWLAGRTRLIKCYRYRSMKQDL